MVIDLYRLYFIHKKIIRGGDGSLIERGAYKLSSSKKGGGLLEGGELFERRRLIQDLG